MDITAQDLFPLVLKLSRQERVRLARMAFSSAAQDARTDADAYLAQPIKPDEFGQASDDPLAWDAEGWEDIK
jgi:hypothetical protein